MTDTDPDIRHYLDDDSSEATGRCAGVEYRLEGPMGRHARRRAARALKKLDPALARLAKQVGLTLKWKEVVDADAAAHGAIADQPSTFLVHFGRKTVATIGEVGFTAMALDLAGIPGRDVRGVLSVALAALLVLLGQTVARTLKRAHIASKDDDMGDDESPTREEWLLAGTSLTFIVAFAAALTTLREGFSHALAQATSTAASTNTGQLTVAAPHAGAPGWVVAILALVAPLIAIVSEFAWYNPRAHRLRRALRLYAANTRKLRYVMRRAARPVTRGRRALLAFDNLRSRAFRMKHVIRAAHGGAEPTLAEHMFDADEPVRELRDRIRWYDCVAEETRTLLLAPHTVDTADLFRLVANAPNGNGNGNKPKPRKAAA